MRTRVVHGTFVAKPPQEVFDFVADVDNSPKWQATLFNVHEKTAVSGTGHLQAQAKVSDARNILGKTVQAQWQVIDYEPARKITMEVVENSPVYWKMTFTTEPVDGGTFLVGDGGGDLGEMNMSPAAFSHACQLMLQNDLATLQQILERGN
jgi:hypothetical protein